MNKSNKVINELQRDLLNHDLFKPHLREGSVKEICEDVIKENRPGKFKIKEYRLVLNKLRDNLKCVPGSSCTNTFYQIECMVFGSVFVLVMLTACFLLFLDRTGAGNLFAQAILVFVVWIVFVNSVTVRT